MYGLNLSKYYTLNILAWYNVIATMFFPIYEFVILNYFHSTSIHQTSLLQILLSEIYLVIYFAVFIIILILGIIELYLRHKKKILKYNNVPIKSTLQKIIWIYVIVSNALALYLLYFITSLLIFELTIID
mgnify:CR=1 FL=1